MFTVKEALTLALNGAPDKLIEAVKLGPDTKAVLEEAIDDGLIEVEELSAMGIV
jgi:hypothetical protein